MKLTRTALVVAAVALLGSACAGAGGLVDGETVDGRNDDLDVLIDAMSSRPSALGDVPEGGELELAARDLREDLDRLTDDEFAVEVARFVNVHALEQDGHSGVFPLAQPWHLAPLRLWEFDDGWYVVDARDRPDLIGARVTSIDGRSIDEVVDRLTPLVPGDGPATRRARLPQFAVTREVLTGSGVGPVRGEAGAPGAIALAFEDGSTTTIATVPAAEYAAWLPEDIPLIPPPLPRRADGTASLRGRLETDPWTATPLPLPPGLFVTYDRVLARGPGGQRIDEFASTIADAADRLEPSAPLIVDLRWNPGGDVTTAVSLIEALTDVARERPVRVLVGRATFSAAALVATRLRAGGATLYGEDTGGAPNAIGDARQVALPTSGLTVHLGLRRATGADPRDRSPTVTPDVVVPWPAADYFAGEDPVLEAARTN